MEIYLIRHTPPLIDKGICYGQSHVPLDRSVFEVAFDRILKQLPPGIEVIYTSPLERCLYLAERIRGSQYPTSPLMTDHRLLELNFGKWELKPWYSIPQAELNPWMKDFVNVQIPGGESYRDLYQRSVAFYKTVITAKQTAIIITHAGVIRSLLSHFSGIDLKDSFKAFELPYSCMVRLDLTNNKLLLSPVFS
jgi:alpha-ribazole phosphatase